MARGLRHRQHPRHPKPSFEVVKAFYPHALHGKTKSGHAIQMEAPGQFSKLIKALRDRGFEDPTRAVVEHVSFVMSYAFANVDPRNLPNGRILRIIDMSRMDLADTTYEAFMFLKTMASSVSIAFPERVHRVSSSSNPPAASACSGPCSRRWRRRRRWRG